MVGKVNREGLLQVSFSLLPYEHGWCGKEKGLIPKSVHIINNNNNMNLKKRDKNTGCGSHTANVLLRVHAEVKQHKEK